MTMRLNLGDYLQENGLTAYRVAQESRGELAANTVYAMAKKPAQRIDLDTVSKIIAVLIRIQKKEVTIVDLLQVVEEPKLHGDPNRAALNGTVQKLKRRGPPAPLAQPTDMTAIVAELRGKVE